ncbi:MAG: MFS transporter [Myxococcota bacterium]|nr:MFS transporter [Myxococcota bacterium]
MSGPTPAKRWLPGHTMAAVATVALFASAPGQTFVVSLFNASLSRELRVEALALNVAYTIATVAAGLPLVYVGALADRFGPRRALAGVALAFALACVVMSSVVDVVTMFVGFFLLRFLGQGALTLVAHHTVAMWFHRRLGSVHAVMQVSLFAAWAFVPMAVQASITSLGWRITYLVLGAVVALAVAPPALRFVRDRPEDLGLRLDGASAEHVAETEIAFSLRAARRTRAYWTLALVFFVSPLIGTALLFDMQPILAARGVDADRAAVAITAWTATMAIFALPAGALTDRVHPAPLLAVASIGMAIACGLAWRASTGLEMAIAMVVLGASQSTISSVAPAAVARFFGRTNHGAIRASISRIAVFGTGLGPLSTGLSSHFTSGYEVALLGFAAASMPVALVCAFLRAPPQPSRPGVGGIAPPR